MGNPYWSVTTCAACGCTAPTNCAEHTRTIIDAVIARAKAKGAKIPKCDHLTVQLHYATGDNTSVDPDNLNPSLKAAVDGLARPPRKRGKGPEWRGLSLVPGDDKTWVTRLPTQVHIGPQQPRRLWLAVRVEYNPPGENPEL